ncbi:cell division protein FtsW [bacterium]|nr:cell division protein FtsW [bacterium]
MIFTKDIRHDSLLLFAVIALVMIGLFMIYSASSFRADEMYGDDAMFFKQHLFRVVLGFLIMFIVSKIDYRRIRWITPFVFLILAVMLVLVFFGDKVNGSRRALSFFGKDMQPSEFVKLAVILYIASLFSRQWKGSQIPEDRLMVHYFIILAMIGLVFLEPDLGTSLIIFAVTMTMFYLGGVSLKTLGKMLACLIPIVSVGLLIFRYQLDRVQSYLEAVFGSGQMSYQVQQSIMGLAHGGFRGVGYGAGTQKLLFLPEPFSDFILASLGEEMGFIGIAAVFFLLGVILWRGVRIALNAPDRFGMLVAGGVTFLILITALMNAGVAVNLLPVTGLPFPFLSYGGSSLLVLMIGVGIILNISKERPEGLRKFTRSRARTVPGKPGRYA